MKNYFTIQKIFSFLTIAALIVNISVSTISNSSAISILLKVVSSGLLMLILYIHLRLSNVYLKDLFASRSLKKTIILMLIIVFYLSLTLFYSSNPLYGSQKIINIIISVIPNIIVLFCLIYFTYQKNFKNYFLFIVTTGFVFTLIAVLLINPFDHSTMYKFSMFRWSHVFIGRMVSFFSLVIFFLFISSKESKNIIIYSTVFVVGTYLTYLTGLRSALLGLAVFSVISTGLYLYKKKLIIKHLYSILIFTVTLVAFIIITPKEFNTPERMGNLLMIEQLNYGDDAPIFFRVESFKLSWQMFKESPLFGYGFGSFKGFNNIDWTYNQKYPHNIILEILSELGIAGLLIFGSVFIIIIRSMYNVHSVQTPASSIQHQVSSIKYPASSIQHPASSIQYPVSSIKYPVSNLSHFLILAFLFSLFLAMFSKDISTQGFLWLFLLAPGAKGRAHSDKLPQ